MKKFKSNQNKNCSISNVLFFRKRTIKSLKFMGIKKKKKKLKKKKRKKKGGKKRKKKGWVRK